MGGNAAWMDGPVVALGRTRFVQRALDYPDAGGSLYSLLLALRPDRVV